MDCNCMDNAKETVNDFCEKYKGCGIELRTDYDLKTSLAKRHGEKPIFEVAAKGSHTTSTAVLALIALGIGAITVMAICRRRKMKAKIKKMQNCL